MGIFGGYSDETWPYEEMDYHRCVHFIIKMSSNMVTQFGKSFTSLGLPEQAFRQLKQELGHLVKQDASEVIIYGPMGPIRVFEEE